MKGWLLVLAGCGRLGFDERAIDAPPPIDARPPEVYRVDVLLYSRLETCLIGDTCAMQPCVSIENDANMVVQQIASNATMRGVPPGDAAIGGAAQSRCMAFTLDAATLADHRQSFDRLSADVSTWTRGELALDMRVHDIAGPSTMSHYMQMVWVNLADLPSGLVSSATDFLFTVQNVRDDATGLHYNFRFCSLRYGSAMGPAGAGYTWWPLYPGSQCANYDVYREHFLIQLFNAYQEQVGPAYAKALDPMMFPPCGTTVDPASYFPDPGTCHLDPDWSACGTMNCDAAAYHQHILETHWVRGKIPTVNHCRNGVMDVGETGIDTGGNC